MSILLKALKQAELDRAAARLAQQTGHAPAEREVIEASTAARERHVGDISSLQTSSGERARRTSTMATPGHGGWWITLGLAVVSAAGFGYWIRGMSSSPPMSAPSGAIRAAVPPFSIAAPGSIPATLQVHEAGPLALRLDRHLDSPGARTR